MADEVKPSAGTAATPGTNAPASTTPKQGPGVHNDANNEATKDAKGNEPTTDVDVNQTVATVQTKRTLPKSATDKDFGRSHDLDRQLGQQGVDVKSAKPMEGRTTVLTSAGELDKESVDAGKVAGTGYVHIHSMGPMQEEDEKK